MWDPKDGRIRIETGSQRIVRELREFLASWSWERTKIVAAVAVYAVGSAVLATRHILGAWPWTRQPSGRESSKGVGEL